jgi:nucleotide-binding universal stress UspA family protein
VKSAKYDVQSITNFCNFFTTDLSENANWAMQYAASLAEAYGAPITVLHVVEKVL